MYKVLNMAHFCIAAGILTTAYSRSFLAFSKSKRHLQAHNKSRSKRHTGIKAKIVPSQFSGNATDHINAGEEQREFSAQTVQLP